MKPADVRFCVDADILGLGKVLGGLRPDVTYPGDPGAVIHRRVRPPCPITTTRIKDTVWIPTISRLGLLILTRDGNIQQHTAELAAVRDNGGRLVALSSKDAVNVWAQLEVVMTRWRDIEKLLDLPGPFIYTLTRTTLNKIL